MIYRWVFNNHEVSGGLKQVITEKLGEHQAGKSGVFYRGCMDVLDHFTGLCLSLGGRIKMFPENKSGQNHELAAVLEHIAQKPPRNLRQGIQLVFLYALAARVRNYGRLDAVLAGLYASDTNRNGLPADTAEEYFSGLFRLMDARMTIYDERVIIGGKGRSNEKRLYVGLPLVP